MSWTLGLQTGHEASACLLRDGEIVAAISDERLTRIKNDGGKYNDISINWLLQYQGLQRSDLTHLAFLYTFFPEKYFYRESWIKEFERKISRTKKAFSGQEDPQMLLGNFLDRLAKEGKKFEDHFKQKDFLRDEGFAQADLKFYDHHTVHAVPAGYFSGFNDCAVVTIDGVGDWDICHTNGLYANGVYERTQLTNQQGASPGLFYSIITKMLGFKPMRHEGKIVGLAAMGNPQTLRTAYLKALRVAEDGLTFTSDFVGAEEPENERAAYLAQVSEGHSREDISAAVQLVLEETVTEVIANYLRKTGKKHLALNGGVFANVKLNQRLAALPEVDSLFVFPPMSDTGNAVGAAVMNWLETPTNRAKPVPALHDVYWGPEFTDEQIASYLQAENLPLNKLETSELVDKAAACIHGGKIVGWFQGRMEFGPRALGNRSMLARPTKSDINNWLNDRLDRSEFMPFAPSVLAEKADEIFIGVEKARHTAEFMTVTFDTKPEWRERIQAVVHVDGTARPQLVRADRNPLYHQLISAYYKLSGIPLVLNTSFNVHEEPIVCAPPEAIRAFVEKRVDCLAVGNYWLEHTS